jgi:hypothetical protein
MKTKRDHHSPKEVLPIEDESDRNKRIRSHESDLKKKT